MKPLSPKLRKLMFDRDEHEPISVEEEKVSQEYEQWRQSCNSCQLADRELYKEAEAFKAGIWEAVEQNLREAGIQDKRKNRGIDWRSLVRRVRNFFVRKQ